MPRNAKEKLPEDQYKNLSKQIGELFSSLGAEQVLLVFENFFTEKECEMLVKRLAAILLLAEGYKPHKVATSLGMSDSTTRFMREDINNGLYDIVLETYVPPQKKRSMSREERIKLFNKIMRLGMPSMGADRWEFLGR